MQKQVPKCNSCKGLIKPMIVFYGEGLPMRFFEHMEKDTKVCDMALVIGTSLLVHPFADLPEIVPNKCQRVLINREPAGDFGERKKDIMILGDCDSQVRALCKLLGWSDELEKLIDTSVETLTEEISLLSVDSTIEKNASEQKKDDNSVNPFTKIEEKKKDEVTLLVSDDE